MVAKYFGQACTLSFTLRNNSAQDIPVYIWVAFTRGGRVDNTPYVGWWIGYRHQGFPGYMVPAGGVYSRSEQLGTRTEEPSPDYYGEYDLEIKVAKAVPAAANAAWLQSSDALGRLLYSLPVIASARVPAALTILSPW